MCCGVVELGGGSLLPCGPPAVSGVVLMEGGGRPDGGGWSAEPLDRGRGGRSV